MLCARNSHLPAHALPGCGQARHAVTGHWAARLKAPAGGSAEIDNCMAVSIANCTTGSKNHCCSTAGTDLKVT